MNKSLEELLAEMGGTVVSGRMGADLAAILAGKQEPGIVDKGGEDELLGQTIHIFHKTLAKLITLAEGNNIATLISKADKQQKILLALGYAVGGTNTAMGILKLRGIGHQVVYIADSLNPTAHAALEISSGVIDIANEIGKGSIRSLHERGKKVSEMMQSPKTKAAESKGAGAAQ